LETNCC